jgi:hypothetical protein
MAKMKFKGSSTVEYLVIAFFIAAIFIIAKTDFCQDIKDAIGQSLYLLSLPIP